MGVSGKVGAARRKTARADDGFTLRRLERAARAAPENPDILLELARTQIAAGRGREAHGTLRRCLRLAPTRIDVLETWADLLHRQGDFKRALGLYKRILKREPRRVTALTHAGILLMKMGHIEVGRDRLRQAAVVRDDPEILYNLALAERAHGDFPAALGVLDRLLTAQPDHHLGHLGKAQVLERMGEAEAAYDALEALMQRGGRSVGALCAFARLAPRFGAAEEARDRLRESLSHTESDEHAKQQLLFALGDVEDSLGNFDEAFEAYERANRLSHKTYQPDTVERATAKTISLFTANRLARQPKATPHRPRPVLIVGMPRSGTSLVEQILDCHPKVTGAGELRYLHDAAQKLSGLMDDPAGLASLSDAQLAELATGYNRTLSQVAGAGTEIVTDKMPTNFEHLGLAAMLAPHARVVHCVRDARDVCLSAFFQNFRTGNPFADDLAKLGHFHRHYIKLMRHWRAVDPLPIVEVPYETLVEKPEETIRRLLDALELPFDQACLRPDRNTRYVNTASADQVRRPIYTGSVGRWRHYAAHLGPLMNALDGPES